MVPAAAGMKVHLAFGYADMRKWMDSLAMLVRSVLKADPFSGHLFAFRGRKANLVKILLWDGTGLCLFSKRFDSAGFPWPSAEDPSEMFTLSPAQLSMLLEGIDWRMPERRWQPTAAG